MAGYPELKQQLQREPRRWLVTGVAGFIGSHLLEGLLRLDQTVVGLDNFATGTRRNLDQVQALVRPEQWRRFRLSEGDIVDAAACRDACREIDFILHQAALGSVPLSLTDPGRCHESNVSGFLNVLEAARAANIRRVVFASSSAVYGDDPGLPKVERRIGQPLSPYAASKLIDEIYAAVYQRAYQQESVGLRYFNVFGPRQSPDGAYAAVIPKWISALLRREPVRIHGDGETTRDFCYVENVVQANLLAATIPAPEAAGQVYNVGLGETTSLNQLFDLLKSSVERVDPLVSEARPQYEPFRAGDVRHSQADISKAKQLLGYAPTHSIRQGLEAAMDWYKNNSA